MRTKKKLLSVLLALTMTLSLLPTTALAVESGVECTDEDCSHVAAINAKHYDTLEAAITASQSGNTITLLADVTNVGLITISRKTITIDLNTHEVGFTEGKYFNITTQGSLTLTGSGKVYEQVPNYAPVILKGGNQLTAKIPSTLNVGKDVTLEGWAGVFIDNNTSGNYGIVVNVDGTLRSVRDKNGDIGSGVYVNGNIKNLTGSVPEITLSETSKIISEGNGIYAAGYAIWNLAGDVTGNGAEALSIKSGTFNITRGTYTAKGTFADPAASNGNGSETTGAALSITSNDGYAKKVIVNVAGGTFISENGYAVYEGIAVNSENSPAATESYATLTILNGSFTGNTEKGAVSITKAENKKIITGGTFSSNVSEYVPDGMKAKQVSNESGTYTIVIDTETAIAEVNGVGYTTLQTAIDAATAGDTVTLLNDVSITKTVEIKKSITLDLDGHTVTAASEMQNSMFSHTSNDNISVTVKNGSVTNGNEDGSGFRWSGGNDSKLTLDNVKLTTEAWAINVTAGTVTVSKDTIVTGNGNDDNVVHVGQSGTLNVYGTVSCTGADYAIYSDSSGATINIYPGAEVSGEEFEAILLDNEATLNISGGTIVCRGEWDAIGLGEIEDDEESTPVTGKNISISGGSFSSSVADYVIEELNYELNSNKTYTYYKTLDEALAAAKTGDTITNLNPDETEDPVTVVTVTYQNGSTVSTENVLMNGTVTLPTPSNYGYNYFQGWSDGTTTYQGGSTVAIAANTTFTAQWVYIPPVNPNPTNSITTNPTANGTLSVSPANASKNTTVVVTPAANAGYELTSLTVVDANGNLVALTANANGTYSFTMPNSRVTVSATFSKIAPKPLPFADVADSAWYADAVRYVYEKGLMTGATNATFEPETATTRGMLVTILYRLEGEPAAGTANFTDVSAGMYYAKAVAWAAANDIVTGYNGAFDPDSAVTREQMAAILYRYAAYKGYDVTARADLSSYHDHGEISAYAVDAMRWTNAEGLITGVTTDTLVPTGASTRAVIATILMRFCENVVK